MNLLIDGARQIGIEISDAHISRFAAYYKELSEWNERINLTAITDSHEVQIKHFLDSLSIVSLVPELSLNNALKLIDVGTGAGFPGIPLAIMLPNLEVTLLEATKKKTIFLTHIVEKLQLANVIVINGRAEEIAHDERFRERYDFVTARALAELTVLVELCLPFCKLGGLAIFQKKAEIHSEIDQSGRALELLGGKIEMVLPVVMPGIVEERCLVTIRKAANSPKKYPRRPGMPSKHPLV